jgi:hypothetical protein
MQRGRLLAWTVFLLVAAFAVLIVFLMGLAWAPGSQSRTQDVLVVVFAGLMALLLIIIVVEIRRTGRRWNSPIFYPAINTSVIGVFAAMFVLFLRHRPWDWQDTSCNGLTGACTTAHHFEPIGLALTLFFGLLIFAPFFRSACDLYAALTTPRARFVARRRLR